MKKIIYSLIIVILLINLSSCNSKMTINNSNIDNFVTKDNFGDNLKAEKGFVKIEENDNLILYINATTAEISVMDKTSGQMWFSNPQNINDDKIASDSEKDLLRSQLQIKYYDKSDNSFTMENFTDSISLSQFDIAKINGGVRITFDIGKKEKQILAPKIIEKSRMAKFVSKMTSEQKSYIKGKYQFQTIVGIDNIIKENLLKQYPSLKNYDAYVLTNNFSDFILEKIADCFSSSSYTLEDLQKDNLDNMVPLKPKPISFSIPIDYTLEGKYFSAKVPTEHIITQNDTVKLTELSLLKFFGCAELNDNGYIFVPDGSGAIINLNNQKTQFNSFSISVYGRDNDFEYLTRPFSSSNCFIPVFGIKKNDSAFYAIIDKGEALSTINADISQKSNSYNVAYGTLKTLEFDNVNTAIDTSKQMNAYQSKPYQGDYKVIYGFLNGNNASYSGMALAYKDYLINKNQLNKVDKKDNINFNLSLLGAVDYNTSFLGLPVTSKIGLTKYDEVAKILSQLKEKGVSNIQVQYKYWDNNGINNTVNSNVKLIDELGGQSKFNDLVKFTKANNINFFPNANFIYVSNDGLFDAFNTYTDGSRFLSDSFAFKYDYNLSTNKSINESRRYIVSPASINKYVTSYLKDYNNLKINGLSIGEMGTELSSDFNKNNITLRDKAKENISNQCAKIVNSGNKILSNSANAYILKYTTSIINAPMQSSNYYITDKSVPFYQIVLSGYIPYSTTPLNYSSDYKNSELKAIETGAAPNFEWTYVDNSIIKSTNYNLNSVYYLPWMEQAVNSYNKINSVNSQVQNCSIISHNEVLSKVFETKYENGVVVYVNYNDYDVVYNGINISASNFALIGGKK